MRTSPHPRRVAWRSLLAPVALTVPLAVLALLAMGLAELYDMPLCGQSFTRGYRAVAVVPALAFGVCMAALAVGYALETRAATRGQYLVAAAGAMVILSAPILIATADLRQGTLSGQSTCWDH